jgi:hypothetical protein
MVAMVLTAVLVIVEAVAVAVHPVQGQTQRAVKSVTVAQALTI